MSPLPELVPRAKFEALKARVDTLAATGGAGVAILGFLEVNAALTKGNLYFRSGANWRLLTPASHEKALGLTAVVDVNSNVIANGSPVDVTGLGYVDGQTYYIENVDGAGRNFAVTPNPLTAAQTPSTNRSFLSIGVVATLGARTLLVYNMQASIDPAAVYSGPA